MDNSTLFALLILFLPLAAFLYQLFFGKKLGAETHFVSLGLMGVVFALTVAFFIQLFNHELTGPILDVSGEWFSTGAFTLELGLYIDKVTVIMLMVVSLISFLVHLYSTAYMEGDSRYSRYFAFLGLFTFSMNGIVLSNSLIMMYLFWELVGLSSYLLIGFWFEKDSAANASKKAFLTNRVGDIGMFIGMLLIFFTVGTFSINGITDAVANGAFEGNMQLLSIAGVLVFMGAVGKSAQFPLHIWLPDAMEGPTPVSALIHAATMVAAGVYMTVRIFPFLTPEALQVVAVIGGITALGAALIAITQMDIKAVLAYSTISQLGYMIMALGVGAYQAGFFHLVTHAMFKACLFLCSGSVIHAMHHSLHHLDDHHTDPQDMDNMGGLRKKMPITYLAMLISTLAISGVPFFSGFLSKDAILAGTLSYYHTHHGWTIFLPIAGFGAAMVTAFYMFRLIFKTFHGEPQKNEIHEHIYESPLPMSIPLIILSILSLAAVFTLPYVNPLDGHGWFTHAVGEGAHVAGLNMHLVNEGIHHAHHDAMNISLIVATLGILISSLFYFFKKVNVEKLTSFLNLVGLYSLSKNKFYVDSIYNTLLYKPFMWFSKLTSIIDWDIYDQKIVDAWGLITLKFSIKSGEADYNWLDQKIIDGFGKFANYFGSELRATQSGVVQNYLMGGIVGLVAIILIFQ
tara:strand:- start:5965 stop:8016 length:2052 start_codon:yes stop_codon:yes gene_type:complete